MQCLTQNTNYTTEPFSLIGASLSEPHIDGNVVCEVYVCTVRPSLVAPLIHNIYIVRTPKHSILLDNEMESNLYQAFAKNNAQA